MKNQYLNRRGWSRRRRSRRPRRLPLILLGIAVLGLILAEIFIVVSRGNFETSRPVPTPSETGSGTQGQTEPSEAPLSPEEELASQLEQAELLAAGYDYDGAIALLSENEAIKDNEQVTAAIAEYEACQIHSGKGRSIQGNPCILPLPDYGHLQGL